MKRFTKNRFTATILSGMLLVGGAALAQDTQPADPQTDTQTTQTAMQAQESVLEVLRGNPDLSTFAQAVEQAGLTDALSGSEAHTVLAPTNQAFEESGIDLASLSAEQVTSLVQNHILLGSYAAADLGTMGGVQTLAGNQLTVDAGAMAQGATGDAAGEVAGGGAATGGEEAGGTTDTPAGEGAGDTGDATDTGADTGEAADDAVGGGTDEAMDEATAGQAGTPTINGSAVTQADLQAGNGVVHVIDTVFVPAGMDVGGTQQPATGTEGADDAGAQPAEEGADGETPAGGTDGEAPAGDDTGTDTGTDTGGDTGGDGGDDTGQQ